MRDLRSHIFAQSGWPQPPESLDFAGGRGAVARWRETVEHYSIPRLETTIDSLHQ